MFVQRGAEAAKKKFITEERRTLRYAVLLKQMRKNMGSECDLFKNMLQVLHTYLHSYYTA